MHKQNSIYFTGMKIITQSFPGSSGSKILPKPSGLPTSSGTPVVVVSPGSSTASNVTMMTKPITSIGMKSVMTKNKTDSCVSQSNNET